MMYFHSTVHATILFKGWHTMTFWELFGSCLAVLAMGALYEGYKTMRESVLRSMSPNHGLPVRVSMSSPSNKVSSSSEALAMEAARTAPKSVGYFDAAHLVQTGMHIGQVFISYCLMLIFMTYNIWLCIAVCLGAGLGYFFFGRGRSLASEANEHCH